jgi:hypothetical protein
VPVPMPNRWELLEREMGRGCDGVPRWGGVAMGCDGDGAERRWGAHVDLKEEQLDSMMRVRGGGGGEECDHESMEHTLLLADRRLRQPFADGVQQPQRRLGMGPRCGGQRAERREERSPHKPLRKTSVHARDAFEQRGQLASKTEENFLRLVGRIESKVHRVQGLVAHHDEQVMQLRGHRARHVHEESRGRSVPSRAVGGRSVPRENRRRRTASIDECCVEVASLRRVVCGSGHRSGEWCVAVAIAQTIGVWQWHRSDEWCVAVAIVGIESGRTHGAWGGV